jgi:hypothetical protein
MQFNPLCDTFHIIAYNLFLVQQISVHYAQVFGNDADWIELA